MNRRDLLKALGLMGISLTSPAYAKKVYANVSQRELRNARAIVEGEINYVNPASLPTVINVFMYGGPSELAGNLTNIGQINTDSQNKYTVVRTDILQSFNATNNTGQITSRGFWKNAGGLLMEDMASANRMSLYRTINRVVDDNKAHRESIFSAQTGGVATMGSPGMGTVLAAMLRVKRPELFNDPNQTPVLPFVSFEGDSVLFDTGDINDLPLWLRSVSLDNNFNNPYRRQKLSPLATGTAAAPGSHKCIVDGQVVDCVTALDNLVATRSGASKFDMLSKSMAKRAELDAFFSGGGLSNPTTRIPGTDIDGVPFDTNPFVTGSGVNQGVRNFTGGFGTTLRAACVLALENPGTRFITLSTGGLGGWDDHDNAIEKYEARITDMISNLRNAERLLRTGTSSTLGGASNGNGRDNVVINVFGEFGRNVNLNGSMGWDHGNNMNLYTFGGAGIQHRALGKVVGSTKVIGTPGQNRLFTSPADGSLQWEPFSIAATVYRYFGVQNPEVLTKDPTMQGAESGFGAIDGFPGAAPLTV